MTTSKVPDTSTTLLRNVADLQHARWSLFYSRYQPMMQAYLRERFPTLDPEDIIQETFAALTKILPDYKYEPEKNGAFHNFLTGVLRNKALCALHQSKRQMAIQERMQLAISVNGKTVQEQSYEEWRAALFEVALQQLLADESIQDRTKQAFIRTAIKGEPIAEVAKSLGVQRNTVDCMRSRMFQKLQSIVEKLKSLC
ncbi:MAG: RNA polymerase sigma factor [Kiritimatiellia bacterium]